MVFDNDLRPGPTLREQLWGHLPIGLLVLGALATFVAMHTAVIGLVAAGLGHVLLGLVLLAIRRHQGTSEGQEQP